MFTIYLRIIFKINQSNITKCKSNFCIPKMFQSICNNFILTINYHNITNCNCSILLLKVCKYIRSKSCSCVVQSNFGFKERTIFIKVIFSAICGQNNFFIIKINSGITSCFGKISVIKSTGRFNR